MPFIGQAKAHTINVITNHFTIDQSLILAQAKSAGFLSPEDAQALHEQLDRVQAELDKLRADKPDWDVEVSKIVAAFNASKPDELEKAFAKLDALIDAQRAELVREEANLRREQARSKYVQATLLYPFETSKAAPLLCAAAELAQDNFWYWIECGRAQKAIGNVPAARAAFEKARELAAQTDPLGRGCSVSLNDLGDVHRDQGDLTAAFKAYQEGHAILRDLAERDPKNAVWARDMVASHWKLAEVDKESVQFHWSEVVRRLEDMKARGILAPVDMWLLDEAKQNLAAAIKKSAK